MSINKLIISIFYLIILSSTTAMAESVNQEPYRLEGYVASILKCPPCPPGAFCKPCMQDNAILIVDSIVEPDPSKRNGVVVETSETDKFAINDKCSLLVKSKGSSNLYMGGSGTPTPKAELVKIESISHQGSILK